MKFAFQHRIHNNSAAQHNNLEIISKMSPNSEISYNFVPENNFDMNKNQYLTGGQFAYRRKDGVLIVPVGCLKK